MLMGVVGDLHILTVMHGWYPVLVKGQSGVAQWSAISIVGRHISIREQLNTSHVDVLVDEDVESTKVLMVLDSTGFWVGRFGADWSVVVVVSLTTLSSNTVCVIFTDTF